MLAKNRELAVVINADRDVAHARVVDTLDALRQTGAHRVAIAVVPDTTRGR
jgi:biopolymer transport protein ExbD